MVIKFVQINFILIVSFGWRVTDYLILIRAIPTAIKDDCGKSRFVVCGNLYQKSAVASSKLIGAVMSPVFCLLKKDTTWWQKTHESYVTSMKAWMKRGKHLLQSLSIAVPLQKTITNCHIWYILDMTSSKLLAMLAIRKKWWNSLIYSNYIWRKWIGSLLRP